MLLLPLERWALKHKMHWSFGGYGYLLWSVFSLLLGARTWNLNQSFFEHFSGHSWLQPHTLISEQLMVRAFQPDNAPPDWRLPTAVPEMVPLLGRRSGANKGRNGPASTGQGHFTVNQDSCHVHGMLLISTFEMVQLVLTKSFYCQPRQLPCDTL